MIRLLGFLVGAAVSIGIFLLILGMPDINLSKDLIDDQDIETVSQVAKDLKTDLEAIAIEVVDEVTEQLAEQETKTKDQIAEDDLPPSEVLAEEAETEFSPITLEEAQIAEFVPEPAATAELLEPTQSDLKWHVFWNPFRSRLAAEGFVGQLEKVTGLDYRVVKIKSGVYEVTFAYENDDERRDKMSLIASSTGLDLP